MLTRAPSSLIRGKAAIARASVLSALLTMTLATSARAEDWPMWGRTPLRQMISPETGCPVSFDIASKTNIKWDAKLGSQSYATPVVAGGLVFIGTNNEGKRDPRYTQDGGVLMIFRENDGKFLWQRYSPKLQSGRVNDWPYQGVCSTVYAEGDYIWYCTNRCEVVCLDVSALRKGTGEPKEVWVVDMMAKLGVFPHNMTACSTASYGDYIYIITGNGVDDTHKNIPAPNAPAIVCFNKKTGAVVWTSNPPGEHILHGQWSSPSITVVNGIPLVIAGLGDSWIYAFAARTGEKVWWFDANLKDTIYPMTRNEIIATPVIVGTRCYVSVGQDPEHGEGPGHLWCLDITKRGDVSLELADAPKPKPGDDPEVAAAMHTTGRPNPNSAVVWHFDKLPNTKPGRANRMNRSISSVTVSNGLAFAPDFSGYLHCLDAETGHQYWVYDMESAVWGSPLVADGKVYLCDEEGDVVVFELSKQLKVLAKNSLDSASYCSPVFANGTLYVSSREHLYAINGTLARGK